MFYNQILRIKAFAFCLFCGYLRDIRKFMEQVEWSVLKFNNFSISIKRLTWWEKLLLNDIPRFSIYLKYVNFAYKVEKMRYMAFCHTAFHGGN